MRHRTIMLLILPAVAFLFSAARPAGSAGAAGAAERFEAVDIYINAKGEALAAYQFEFTAKKGDVAILSLEGGAHAAFRDAPYYDPAALTKGRIIVAAFQTGGGLPKGRTRVARIHLMVRGDVVPEYEVKLIVAASDEGTAINATAGVGKGE